jgi:hypothetical protein
MPLSVPMEFTSEFCYLKNYHSDCFLFSGLFQLFPVGFNKCVWNSLFLVPGIVDSVLVDQLGVLPQMYLDNFIFLSILT